VSADLHRYFIDLPPAFSDSLTRLKEQELRRRAALDFVTGFSAWLDETGMKEKVARLDVTLFGQILITCESQVIESVRGQDKLPAFAIRAAAGLERMAQSRLSA
jgi:hypothetical protein